MFFKVKIYSFYKKSLKPEKFEFSELKIFYSTKSSPEDALEQANSYCREKENKSDNFYYKVFDIEKI
jgi:hypothetical protein